MSSEFPFPLYYFGLLIITLFLSRFIFRRYIGFAKRYNFTKSINARAAHKGLVFTGGGVVYASVIMVAAVVLDNLDFVEFEPQAFVRLIDCSMTVSISIVFISFSASIFV